MSINLSQSTQFKIRDLTLITKVGNINITGVYQELNIFDSIFMPCMKGDILIQDAIGLSSKLLLDGSEYLSVEIGKADENSGTSFKRTFRVYKLTNRKNANQNSEMYILHFTSEEMVYSMQQKINQSFTGIYSDVAKKVLINYLNVPTNKIANIEPTKGLHSIVMPILSPIDAMGWLTKKSLNSEGLPNYFFFENKAGFNFISLSTLIAKAPITSINFEPKNIRESMSDEFLGARDMNVVSQFNLLDNIQNGVYAGKFIGIDPLTRQVNVSKIDYLKTYSKTNKHLNKFPNFTGGKNRKGLDAAQMYDSKVSLYPFSSLRPGTPYIKTNDPKTSTIIDDTHAYVFQRAPIISNLLQTTIHVSLPGNFGLSSGYVVNLTMPTRATKSDSQNSLDNTLNGKYLITATHHMIKSDRHETIIEVATDSTNKQFSTIQTSDMKGALAK
jgi:hypothetical protein